MQLIVQWAGGGVLRLCIPLPHALTQGPTGLMAGLALLSVSIVGVVALIRSLVKPTAKLGSGHQNQWVMASSAAKGVCMPACLPACLPACMHD